jgi:hypothetical protein
MLTHHYPPSQPVGIPYPDNSIPYCQGKIGHQFDIPLLFASGPSATTPQQLVASKEVQSRWSAFVATGNPNPTPNLLMYPTWSPVQNQQNLNMMVFGAGTGGRGVSQATQRYPQCNFGTGWGSGRMPFDCQLYS